MKNDKIELIVFNLGRLNLALRINSVYKVTNYASISGSGTGFIGVTQVEDREVTVIDLYQRFFKSNQLSEYSTGGYIVLVQTATGELYGIPVVHTPALMEVPLSLLRVLPESYRYADTLDIASHVAVIPQGTSSLTVFVLDIERLLPVLSQTQASAAYSK